MTKANRYSPHRQATDQVAERQEFFRSKISVCELVTEEQADNRCDLECVQDPRLLDGENPSVGK